MKIRLDCFAWRGRMRFALSLPLVWLVTNTSAAQSFSPQMNEGLLSRNIQTSPLSFIKIVEGTSGDGPQLGAITLTTDQTLTVHAAGYDSSNNYVGDQIVTWSVAGEIGVLSTTTGASTTLNPNRPGTGVIIADHATATDDTSGTITVTIGAAHHVKVLSGPSGNTIEVNNVTLTAGQTFVVHASMFDADDNYAGDVSVNWSVSGGIGILNPVTGISTTFTATTVGAGVIAADHSSLLDDATDTFTVTAGPLNFVKIGEGVFGDGPELGNKSLTTDQTLTVHAAGYDVYNNYLGDATVIWRVSGGIGTLSVTEGTTTTLDARSPGAGTIMADHATAIDDDTGPITVFVGAAHHIKILHGASGNTPEVITTTLVVGQTLSVHASSFDADDNFIGDIGVDWSMSGGIGTLTPTTGVATTFTATTVGSGIINADHPVLIDDVTGTIIVNAGILSYVKIVEGSVGNGPDLGNKSLTTDQTLTVHAAGYDASNNYLGDQTVTWSVSGGIGTLLTTIGTTTTLDARRPGTGIITADHATVIDDNTGTITVFAGAAHHIKILNSQSGNTPEVITVTMTAGQTLAVHAGAFDADDNYVVDVSVNWTSSGGIGTLNPVTGVSTIFAATTVGSGVISAEHPTLIGDATGTIIVNSGTLSYLKIIEGPSGNGPELGNKTMTTDQTLTVHAAGYDAAGNYLGDQVVTWSLSGGIGVLSPTSGTSTTFSPAMPGTGAIVADHATAIDDATGTIIVTVGATHHVKVLGGTVGATSEVGNVTLTTGQTLTVHASGFDADGNYISDVSVNWSVTGGIGTLTPTTGISTTLTATTVGSGVIAADHATLIDDVTGTIVVTLGTWVTDLEQNSVPRDFMLSQNYPNPFNARSGSQHLQTRINYELPATSPVKIAIYNLNGALIRKLFEGQQSAGRYIVTWDGTATSGAQIASGVYLVRMEAGRFVAMRKMVVAR